MLEMAPLPIGQVSFVPVKKKRMLVLICEGGGGHKTAGEALRSIFSHDYEVVVVNVLSEVIHRVDFLRTFSSGFISGEDIYNFLLAKGFYKGVGIWATLGNKYMHKNRYRIEKCLEKYLDEQASPYDIVISTTPFINLGLAQALQKKKIPFVIVPTDLDTTTFFTGMRSCHFASEDRVVFSLPYDDDDLKAKGGKEILASDGRVVITGFPVRQECQKTYSKDEVLLLKLKHGISTRRKVITVVLGTLGGKRLLSYTKALSGLSAQLLTDSLAINICVGKNEKVQKTILRWLLQQGASLLEEKEEYISVKAQNGTIFHLRKFTKELIEIFVCSDIVITKTGSCSVNEAIYLGKKLLLDNTLQSSARYLFWETFNLHFVRKHGLGDVFYDLEEMKSLIEIFLREDSIHPVKTGAFLVPDFRKEIQSLVTRLIV